MSMMLFFDRDAGVLRSKKVFWHPAQPHVGDVLHKQTLHLAARVHIVEVGVDDHLQEHPRMVAAGAAALVAPLDFGDVQPVNDGADHACLVVLGQVITQTRRK